LSEIPQDDNDNDDDDNDDSDNDDSDDCGGYGGGDDGGGFEDFVEDEDDGNGVMKMMWREFVVDILLNLFIRLQIIYYYYLFIK
jgi:hypothetical protein